MKQNEGLVNSCHNTIAGASEPIEAVRQQTLGYIKEATYQFSHLYLHGKWSNSWVLQSVIQGV